MPLREMSSHYIQNRAERQSFQSHVTKGTTQPNSSPQVTVSKCICIYIYIYSDPNQSWNTFIQFWFRRKREQSSPSSHRLKRNKNLPFTSAPYIIIFSQTYCGKEGALYYWCVEFQSAHRNHEYRDCLSSDSKIHLFDILNAGA